MSDWEDYSDSGWDEYTVEGSDWDVKKPRSGCMRRWPLILALVIILGGAGLFLIRRGNRDSEPLPTATAGMIVQATNTRVPNTATAVPPLPTETIVVPTPTLPLPTETPQPQLADFPLNALQQQMLRLINEARVAEGLNEVIWDPVAAGAGLLHAKDMIDRNYFSHWNPEGLGPEHRYTLAGGRHAVFENLHARVTTWSDGSPAAIEDWPSVITEAHQGLLESPGHRENIMNPAHTHVGIGMAYDGAAGQFRLAQEFSNQYVVLTGSLPIDASLGESVSISGVIPGDNISNVLLDLAYEPFPRPMTNDQLSGTSTYFSAAESVDTKSIPTNFDEVIVLDSEGRPGIYSIRIFADIDGQQALLVNHCIWVEGDND
jgi:uncharacterized protein YkwD